MNASRCRVSSSDLGTLNRDLAAEVGVEARVDAGERPFAEEPPHLELADAHGAVRDEDEDAFGFGSCAPVAEAPAAPVGASALRGGPVSVLRRGWVRASEGAVRERASEAHSERRMRACQGDREFATLRRGASFSDRHTAKIATYPF